MVQTSCCRLDGRPRPQVQSRGAGKATDMYVRQRDMARRRHTFEGVASGLPFPRAYVHGGQDDRSTCKTRYTLDAHPRCVMGRRMADD